jgi:hypothetical protein
MGAQLDLGVLTEPVDAGVPKDGLHAMSSYLTDAFLRGAVPLSTESEGKRNSNPRKIQPVEGVDA